jgi:hypothetical protein
MVFESGNSNYNRKYHFLKFQFNSGDQDGIAVIRLVLRYLVKAPAELPLQEDHHGFSMSLWVIVKIGI